LGFESMRAYLAEVENKGLLQNINGADWKIEIGAITEVVAFSPAPRVLLFDNIQDYPAGFRVATNLYSAQRLQAIALGLPDNLSTIDLVSRWRARSKQLKPAKPRLIKDGPILQNVIRGNDVNLLRFPLALAPGGWRTISRDWRCGRHARPRREMDQPWRLSRSNPRRKDTGHRDPRQPSWAHASGEVLESRRGSVPKKVLERGAAATVRHWTRSTATRG
jgi:hypothetical protein